MQDGVAQVLLEPQIITVPDSHVTVVGELLYGHVPPDMRVGYIFVTQPPDERYKKERMLGVGFLCHHRKRVILNKRWGQMDLIEREIISTDLAENLYQGYVQGLHHMLIEHFGVDGDPTEWKQSAFYLHFGGDYWRYYLIHPTEDDCWCTRYGKALVTNVAMSREKICYFSARDAREYGVAS